MEEPGPVRVRVDEDAAFLRPLVPGRVLRQIRTNRVVFHALFSVFLTMTGIW